MFCGNCGSKTLVGDRFCSTCGQAQRPASASESDAAEAVESPPPADQTVLATQPGEKPSHGLFKVWVPIAALALVAGLVWFGLGSRGQEQQSTGYNDPDTLAHSVLVQYNERAHLQATSANCVNSAPHAFVCLITNVSRGTAISEGVVVSEDGNSWVTTP
jgi:phage tail sheath gpL-like